MKFSTLVYFYIRRLRTHPAQEALAGFGIAVGVALVFAVQIANGSITSDSRHVLRSIVGEADLQLRTRSEEGLPQDFAERVRRLPGVRTAAAVLDLSGTVRGPNGRTVLVQMASSDGWLPSVAGIARGVEHSHLRPSAPDHPEVLLPRGTAALLGVSVQPGAGISRPSPLVTLQIDGRATWANVMAVLGHEDVGAFADAQAAILDLPTLQRLAGLSDRITGVLIQSRPGAHAVVTRELRKLAGGRLTVGPASEDVRLLEQATVPSDRATGFFAFVSGMVGILLAFSAMLLSTPERRRVIADLRIHGTRRGDLAKMLLFQAFCLGFIASVIGVVVGATLSRGLFHQTPGYLALAFPLGTQTVIGWQPVVLSLVGGIAATCLAAFPPLLDLRRSRAVDAVYFEAGEPGHAISVRTGRLAFAAAVCLLVVSILAPVLFGAAAAIPAVVGVAFVGLLAIPLVFAGVVKLGELVGARRHGPRMLLVATRTLRATTARSLALAATGTIAVFGTVAAGGAHRDLLSGLYNDYRQYVSTASIWVTNPKDDLATTSLRAGSTPSRIEAVPGVRSVRAYQGGFLDAFGRRIWLISRSPSVMPAFPSGQVVAGSSARAARQLALGGWITVSRQIATMEHVSVGGLLTLPTPSGARGYRVAAITTNLGWSPGAIVLNQADYRRAWGTAAPTALEVQLAPGANAAATRRAILAALPPGTALEAQTSSRRQAEADALAREGLSRLSDISLLLTVAAVLAMAAAMGASMWQRRPALASLRIQSFTPAKLRVVLLWESALVVATGCLIGAAAGLYGHALIDRYLRSVTGFPAPFSTAVPQGLETTAAILAAALVILALPGIVASRVPPALALQDRA